MIQEDNLRWLEKVEEIGTDFCCEEKARILIAFMSILCLASLIITIAISLITLHPVLEEFIYGLTVVLLVEYAFVRFIFFDYFSVVSDKEI
jgi:hypothetical protein